MALAEMGKSKYDLMSIVSLISRILQISSRMGRIHFGRETTLNVMKLTFCPKEKQNLSRTFFIAKAQDAMADEKSMRSSAKKYGRSTAPLDKKLLERN